MHGMLRAAAQSGPLAVDQATGATIVLRHRDLEALVHDPRLVGIGQTLFDTMGMAADMATDSAAAMPGGGDLVTALAPLGTRLICRLLGVSDEDVAVFSDWAEALSPVFFVMTPEQVAAATTALLAAETDGERLTHDETVTMIANLLVADNAHSGRVDALPEHCRGVPR